MAKKKKRKRIVGKAVKPKREVPLLSIGETKRLEEENRQDKLYLRGMDEGSDDVDLPVSKARPVDADAVRARIRRREKALTRMSPKNRRLTGVAANSALVQMKKDEEWLRKNMLSTWDMGAFPDPSNPDKDHKYRMAVAKSEAQEVGNPEYQMRSARYKSNARRIDPENSELCNIERFRSTSKH